MNNKRDGVCHVGVQVPDGAEGDLVVVRRPVSVGEARPRAHVGTDEDVRQVGHQVEGTLAGSVLRKGEAAEEVTGLRRQLDTEQFA